MARRTINVDYLARVEGEGALTIKLDGDRATSVQLRIYEPPRFFEALLAGKSALEAPDITSRICGICPIAYITSACNAVEDALGIEVEPSHQTLRRLIYCGEWLESHALHVFMLHLPDFLGFDDALALAKQHGDIVRDGLRMKKAGNAIVSLIGGREVHPINTRVGGFYRSPRRDELQSLLPELRWARDAIDARIDWLAALTFPSFERNYQFVAMRHPEQYPMALGRIASSSGLDISASEYDTHFEELHVEHSTALHARVRGGGHYHCGPLARFALCHDQLSERARSAAARIGLVSPCHNPFKSILVRAVEMLHAYETAVALIEQYSPPSVPAVSARWKAGVGYGCSEAPRGLLWHRYALDEQGKITQARIVPPTAQNQACIEDDLREMAPELARLPKPAATWRAEQAIRNYDPCISCSTHFLRLEISRV